MYIILIILCVIVLFFTKAGKNVLGTFVGIIALLVLLGLWATSKSCGSDEKTVQSQPVTFPPPTLPENLPRETNTPTTTVNEPAPPPAAPVEPTPIGDIEKHLPDCTVIIHSFSNPFKGHQAGNGNKYVAANVEIINTGKTDIGYSDEFQWKLRDADGYSYDAVSLDIPHALGTGGINPGQKIRGLVIFEVPINTHGCTLHFNPGLLDDDVDFHVE